MKTKSLVAACLAGFGVYLAITGSITVVLLFSMLTSELGDPSTRTLMLVQYIAPCIPCFVGVVFVVFASKLASLICRVAKAEESFTGIIHPEVAILVACVISGLVVAITEIPELVQLSAKQFLAAASATYAAEHRYEDYRSLLVRPAITAVLGLLVMWKARSIARWLVARYEFASPSNAGR